MIRIIFRTLPIVLISIAFFGESVIALSAVGMVTPEPGDHPCFVPSTAEPSGMATELRGKTEPRLPSVSITVVPHVLFRTPEGRLLLIVQRHVMETFRPAGLLLLTTITTSSSL